MSAIPYLYKDIIKLLYSAMSISIFLNNSKNIFVKHNFGILHYPAVTRGIKFPLIIKTSKAPLVTNSI